MLRSVVAIAFGAMLLPAFAQSPAPNVTPEQKPSAEASKTPAGGDATLQPEVKADAAVPPKWEPNSPQDLLQQAYYAGGQLPNDEHAYQMGELVIVAAKMKHPMLRQWVHETLQLTQGLPQQGSMRQPTEQAALVALAELDPAEALQLLSQLTPASVVTPATGSVADDGRTNAARQIFPKYWKGVKSPEIEALRSAANYLGETGQYPFAALGLVIKDIHTMNAAIAESLFLDAIQYYGREQMNTVQVHIEFIDLLKAAKGIVSDAMERVGIELAVDRLLKQAAEPEPSDVLFVGRIYTNGSFVEFHSIVEGAIFRLLPLVREFEADLEQRINEKVTTFKNPVPSDVGPLPEGYEEAIGIVRRSPDLGEKSTMLERLRDSNRANGARQLSATDPEAALRLANSITDAVLKTATLLAIDPDKAKETTAKPTDGTGGAQRQNPPDSKAQLAVFLPLARSQAKGDSNQLWDTLNRGLDLAEELFVEGLKKSRLVGYRTSPDWNGPMYAATGFFESNALLKIGMEKQTTNTMGWLAKEHDPALKSYLLISAAEGLWNKQKPASAPGASPATPQPPVTRTMMTG